MKRIIRVALVAVLIVVALPYVLTPLYRAGHPVSTLMLWRWATGAPVTRDWRDLDVIAAVLPRTVIAAEDAKFCAHNGIDWETLQEVIEDAQDGEPARGGSTITQQLAKNLFLWGGRSYVRKALELPLALWIDAVLPKGRILELYLNVAEWGPAGQFGAEAGARHAFGKAAAQLTAHEAALLAAILPNPVVRSASRPSRGVRRRAGIYIARARAIDLAACSVAKTR
ncbi:MAG: monofunctional biosynthetic peptidoglycan transglycosylase [Proteobacteria bacterium]|nr:MAG: monofunctional biosynthetic peptidoglycan transglycosylase [Pseudomonadota bacterium]